jgi:hypothetical protein
MKDDCAWWNSDILKVERAPGGDFAISLNSVPPPNESYLEALIAVRFLLARYNIEPQQVVMEFGADSDVPDNLRERLRGTGVEHPDGSLSWGGFVIKKA